MYWQMSGISFSNNITNSKGMSSKKKAEPESGLRDGGSDQQFFIL